MGVPNVYRKSNEQALASYDYIDYATGQGYKTFYAGAADLSGATVYFITSIPEDSSVDVRYVAANNNAQEKSFDLDFQNPAILQGTVIAAYSLSFAANAKGWVSLRLYHVRGSTETLIGEGYSDTWTDGGSGSYRREGMRISLTKKKFAISDKLRLKARVVEEATANLTLWFDPSSRQTLTETGTSSSIGTDLVLSVPFRIDI